MVKTVDVLDLLEAASQWLVEPENEQYRTELNKIKSEIVIRSFLPMDAKKTLVQDVIMKVMTADPSLYGFADALELSLTFDVLLSYTNIEWQTSYEVKCDSFYDILWGSGVCDDIINRCRSDYERTVKLIEMSLSCDNLKSLIETIKNINPDSLEKTMKEINKLKLDIDPKIIRDLAQLSRSTDPLLNQVADVVEATAYKAAQEVSGVEEDAKDKT